MKANSVMGESYKKIEYMKNIDIPAFLEMITNQDDEISLKSVPFRLWFIINKDDLWICLKLPRAMADNRSMQIVINGMRSDESKQVQIRRVFRSSPVIR
jgi:hypothetical protein